ncbi:MAG: esterase [Burkholderiales bacterium]|nr:esterase [Burkholderiales bacterium]
MILYLHGFRSSPQSFKARLLADRMAGLGRADEFACPQLSERPQTAMAQALRLARTAVPDGLTVVGSSLGGFYATYVAERCGCRAVLLNPALRAHEKLARHVGTQTAYHDPTTSFEFRREYLDELRQFHVDSITRPERYLLIAATGDELLDWREMAAAFPGARQRIIDGGDHALSDFERHADAVLEFARIALDAS